MALCFHKLIPYETLDRLWIRIGEAVCSLEEHRVILGNQNNAVVIVFLIGSDELFELGKQLSIRWIGLDIW